MSYVATEDFQRKVIEETVCCKEEQCRQTELNSGEKEEGRFGKRYEIADYVVR